MHFKFSLMHVQCQKFFTFCPSLMYFFVENGSFNSDLEPVTCEAPVLPNGNINYNKPAANNGEYPVDTRASFTCHYAFKMNGSASITCQFPGTWNEKSPECLLSN